MRIKFFFIFLFSWNCFWAQDLVHYNPIKAEVKGGAPEIEQVLQTQLTMPKNALYKGYQDNVSLYFLLDSVGKPSKPIIKSDVKNKAVYNELTRLLNFFQFIRTNSDPNVPYFLTFNLSSQKYNSYQKQKSRINSKKPLKADSSFVVYSRADKSPEYYRNGEEGLKEFILTDLEYPQTAIDKSIQGTVVLEFIVETNGFVTGITPKQFVGAGGTEEAIRLIKKTKWQPALLNNKLVRYKMTYPITFSLRNANKDTGFSNPAVGN